MAKVGMLHPTFATVSTYVEGTAPTYTGGKRMGKAISGEVTFNTADNPLYADNAIAENDRGVNGFTVSVGLDDIAIEDRVALFGEKKTTGSESTPDEYAVVDGKSPRVGFGYVAVHIRNGAKTYEAFWAPIVQFSQPNETANTKGESIEWQTPTVEGSGIGVSLDNSGDLVFIQHVECDTLAKADTWLNGKAGITA